jgi:hypothetical protein
MLVKYAAAVVARAAAWTATRYRRAHQVSRGVSERRGCHPLGIDRSLARYVSHSSNQGPLQRRIQNLAAARCATANLRSTSCCDGKVAQGTTRVCRPYREDGFSLRLRLPCCNASAADEMGWTAPAPAKLCNDVVVEPRLGVDPCSRMS